jgi:hypothetical protein
MKLVNLTIFEHASSVNHLHSSSIDIKIVYNEMRTKLQIVFPEVPSNLWILFFKGLLLDSWNFGYAWSPWGLLFCIFSRVLFWYPNCEEDNANSYPCLFVNMVTLVIYTFKFISNWKYILSYILFKWFFHVMKYLQEFLGIWFIF